MITVLIFLLRFFTIRAEDFKQWWSPVWSRAEFIQNTPPDVLKKLAGRQRHLIFKVGPPASGKTDALEWGLREMGILREPYLELNVDLFVEKNQAYKDTMNFAKEALLKVVAEHDMKPCVFSVSPSECTSIIPMAVSRLVCETDSQAYFKHRPAAEKEVQSLLFAEFLEAPHYRNIVYESTGSQKSYEYILKLGRMARIHGYKVHIIYPFVQWSELIRRSELRALKLGRLVCTERIRQIRKESRWNLRDIIRKLDSVDFPVDSVLILNNDGPKGRMKKICHFHKNPGRRKIHGSEAEI